MMDSAIHSNAAPLQGSCFRSKLPFQVVKASLIVMLNLTPYYIEI